MIMTYKHLYFAFLLMTAMSINGQLAKDTGLVNKVGVTTSHSKQKDHGMTPEQVKEDVDILVKTLNSNHPGLYDYQSKEDFEKFLKVLDNEIASAKSIFDEYRIVSRVVAMVGDAHTYTIYPNDGKILQDHLLFPVIPKVDNNEITIDGKKVQSINGKRANTILKELQVYLNSDGNTLPYKNAFIEMEFPLRYFLFIDDADAFKVIFENGESIDLKGRSYYNEGLRPKQASPTFQIKENRAILKIPSWEDNTAGSFNNDLSEMANTSVLGKFMKSSLEEAIENEVEQLVVDLRGNKGGKSGPAAILLSYLIATPFKYYDQIKVAGQYFPTKEFITNQELVAFYESDTAQNMIQETAGELFFKKSLLPKIQPNANQFKGTLEILVDKYTLSVSTDVAAILKNHLDFIVTGEEIGGSLEHYCAGNYINLKLPHSAIEVNIPLQRLQYEKKSGKN